VKNKRKMKGFTIIELVAVIAIVLIMASMIVPRVTGYTQTANNTKYFMDAKNIAQAVEIYNANKSSDKINGVTKLDIVKSKLMPTTEGSEKYLSSWPEKLRVKDSATTYKDAAESNLKDLGYQTLLDYIDDPEK
jgi:prepilin-type N-terminal cleavage/methylation domain-containing protein